MRAAFWSELTETPFPCVTATPIFRGIARRCKTQHARAAAPFPGAGRLGAVIDSQSLVAVWVDMEMHRNALGRGRDQALTGGHEARVPVLPATGSKAPGPEEKLLQILKSRRPDSNRGLLHYELWAAVTTSHQKSPQVTRRDEYLGLEVTHGDR